MESVPNLLHAALCFAAVVGYVILALQLPRIRARFGVPTAVSRQLDKTTIDQFFDHNGLALNGCPLRPGDLLFVRRRNFAHRFSSIVAGALSGHVMLVIGNRAGRIWVMHAAAPNGVRVAPFSPRRYELVVLRRLVCPDAVRSRILPIALHFIGRAFSPDYFRRGARELFLLPESPIRDDRMFCTSFVLTVYHLSGVLREFDARLYCPDDLLFERFAGEGWHRPRELPFSPGSMLMQPEMLVERVHAKNPPPWPSGRQHVDAANTTEVDAHAKNA